MDQRATCDSDGNRPADCRHASRVVAGPYPFPVQTCRGRSLVAPCFTLGCISSGDLADRYERIEQRNCAGICAYDLRFPADLFVSGAIGNVRGESSISHPCVMSRLIAHFHVHYLAFHLNVDLDIPMSGITAIFGPSGSGKTTLLRCLAGLEQAPNGFVQFGTDVWQDEKRHLCLPLYKRPVRYVFQEPRLFPHYNVRSNLLYGYKRIPLEAHRIAIEQVIDILGISHLLERRIHKLSSGEQQRVAIGRALLTSPNLLLLDEPFASLDIQRKQEFLPFIRRLHEALRIPVMYVSHATAEILQLADRVILLKEGQVVGIGALNEMLTSLRFRGSFGAHRVGGVLETRVVGHDPQYGLTQLEFKGQSLFVPLQPVSVGQPVCIHILSNDVSLVTERTDSPTSVLNILEATIQEIHETDQSSVDVLLDIGAPIVASITRKSLAHLGLKPGHRVFAHIKAVALNEELVE